MTKTISIQKSDCVDNETFESLVDSAGLSCFDAAGDPKDVDCLTITGMLTNDVYERFILIYKNDIDETTWSDIAESFGLDADIDSISIQIEEVSLV